MRLSSPWEYSKIRLVWMELVRLPSSSVCMSIDCFMTPRVPSEATDRNLKVSVLLARFVKVHLLPPNTLLEIPHSALQVICRCQGRGGANQVMRGDKASLQSGSCLFDFMACLWLFRRGFCTRLGSSGYGNVLNRSFDLDFLHRKIRPFPWISPSCHPAILLQSTPSLQRNRRKP